MNNLRFFISLILILPTLAFSQKQQKNSSHSQDFIENLMHLSYRKLNDTADFYFDRKISDTALICYNLLINTPVKSSDFEKQKMLIEAVNKISIIYFHFSDYNTSYEYLIKALLLCEKYNYDEFLPKIYNNMGNIYSQYKRYDIAKGYYAKALAAPQDSTTIIILLNNLGAVELESGQMDSAANYLNKSLQISRKHDDFLLYDIWNNIATLYHKKQLYDSAYYYYYAALKVAKDNNKYAREAQNFSDLGKLFFELNKRDSALIYIDWSNKIAKEYNFPRFIAENYLTLSKIEEAKGNTQKAFEYYKNYANLNDSIYNVQSFGDINQLQRLYEDSKTNQKIEQLIIKQQIKERTIFYLRIIWAATSCILLLVTLVLIVIFIQKRNLNRAYKALFEKNIEIIELQDHSSAGKTNKNKKTVLSDELQDELLDKILLLMEDTSIICDTEFTINRLAELVDSNRVYISQIINSALKKNFRTFLNGYRIREAQRLFSEPDAQKYTIESIALRVGFKSRTAFREVFKEITGVTPNYYLTSIMKSRIIES